LADFDYDPALAEEGVAVFLAHRNRVVPFEDVLPNLGALGERHRLVSITNGNADVAETPLRGFFHLCLTAAGVGAARPNPRLLHTALEQTGTEPAAALHLGDDPYLDVAVARGVGMRTAWVNRYGLTWPAELPSPEVEVADLRELRTWLEGQGG
jgi:putative hydrolase of the HAD superfamily